MPVMMPLRVVPVMAILLAGPVIPAMVIVSFAPV
jgi:hypothetical protein